MTLFEDYVKFITVTRCGFSSVSFLQKENSKKIVFASFIPFNAFNVGLGTDTDQYLKNLNLKHEDETVDLKDPPQQY